MVVCLVVGNTGSVVEKLIVTLMYSRKSTRCHKFRGEVACSMWVRERPLEFYPGEVCIKQHGLPST